MFQAIGRHLSPIARLGMADLLNSRFTALALKLMGSRGRSFGPLFRNTVNPTIVRGGDQINVVPGVVSVDLDGRLLPNMPPDRLISELAVIAGKDATISRLVRHSKWPFTGERSGRHPCAHAHACGDGWKVICPPWHTYGFCQCCCHQHWISLRSPMAPMSVPQWMPSTLEQTRFTACCKGVDAPPRLGVGMPYFV